MKPATAKHTRCTGSRLLAALSLSLLLCCQPVFAGSITLYYTDANGSPVAAADVDGNILWREHYEPYGKKLNRPSGEDVGYTGHEFDRETGLTYMQARYYDPEVGRFLAIDPVGYKPGQPMTFNRYSYANNNPYKYVDPDGAEIVFVATKIASKEEIKQVASNLLKNSEVGDKFIGQLNSSKNKWVIKGGTVSFISVNNKASATNGNGTGGSITVNLFRTDVVSTTDGNKEITPEEALLHESVHGADADKGNLDHSINPSTGNPVKEDRAMKIENAYRDEQGLPGHREVYPIRPDDE